MIKSVNSVALVILVVQCGLSSVLCDYFQHHSGIENSDEFSNEWIVRIGGGQQVAELIALQLGYHYGDKVPNFPDTYIFIKDNHDILRRDPYNILTRNLSQNPNVEWAEQLFSKKRQKRDFIHSDDNNPLTTNARRENILFNKHLLAFGIPQAENHTTDSEILDEDKPLHRVKREDLKIPKQEYALFNDELWSQEWYLQDTRTRDDLPKLDLNVLPVYKMGITGKGVKVSILDDGIEYLHEDLKANYDPSISWDCNEKDDDPIPRYDLEHRNAHGTRCAGEVAMTANNGKCGVGIAYDAKIGGIKLLDGVVNDRVEGTALGFAYDKIDIYSASWGPNDDGKTVEGPGRLAQEALERGVTKGRNGKGTIFVWASGNGGSRQDNCNCDGYIGSIYTVSIGSASQKGAFPWYGEPCAATLAVTYSSGAYEDQMIATTDLNNECTIKHTGTSAAAPLAAGIIALALQANQNLSWRDIQHLIVWTSEYAPLADNLGWIENGAGFRFDVRFGFGLMNAHSMVMSALNFTSVPEKSICSTPSFENINTTISYNNLYSTRFYSTGCFNTADEVNFLEHIEVKVNILYAIRGVLEIYLTSPKGTRIPLLNPRKFDHSTKGFINWRFMSVATWGETSKGTWTLEIYDGIGPASNIGMVGPLTLILHGTKEQPKYMLNGPRSYNNDYTIINNMNTFDENPSSIEIVKDSLLMPKMNDTSFILDASYEDLLENDYLKYLWLKLKSKDDSGDLDDIVVNSPNENNILNHSDEDKTLYRVHHHNSRTRFKDPPLEVIIDPINDKNENY